MVEGGEDTQKIYAILIKKFTTKEKIINFLHEFVKSFGDKQEKQKKIHNNCYNCARQRKYE